MKSVTEHLGENFTRIRIGIGAPKYKEDLINYVIGKIPKTEQEELDKSTETAKEAVLEILKSGSDIAMNKFN